MEERERIAIRRGRCNESGDIRDCQLTSQGDFGCRHTRTTANDRMKQRCGKESFGSADAAGKLEEEKRNIIPLQYRRGVPNKNVGMSRSSDSVLERDSGKRNNLILNEECGLDFRDEILVGDCFDKEGCKEQRRASRAVILAPPATRNDFASVYCSKTFNTSESNRGRVEFCEQSVSYFPKNVLGPPPIVSVSAVRPSRVSIS